MRNTLLIAFVVMLLAAFFTHYAHSEELDRMTYSKGTLYWQGPINDKNLSKFGWYYDNLVVHTLELSSRGGDPDTGMVLGNVLKHFSVKVRVRKGDYCVSACAYAAAAAKELELKGVLAFHIPYYDQRSKLTHKKVFEYSIRIGMALEHYFLSHGFPSLWTKAMLEHTSQDRFYLFKSVRELNLARDNYKMNKSLHYTLTRDDYPQYVRRLRKYMGRGKDINAYAEQQRQDNLTVSDEGEVQPGGRMEPPNLQRIPTPTFRPDTKRGH